MGTNGRFATVVIFENVQEDVAGILLLLPLPFEPANVFVIEVCTWLPNYSPAEFVWNNTVGVTALTFLNSDKYEDQYQNDLFVADVNHGNVYHFDLNQNRTHLLLPKGSSLSDRIAEDTVKLEDLIFTKAPGGITDMQLGPDGYLYVLSLGEGARGDDCTPDRNQYCVDYEASLGTGAIYKVVPAP